MGENRRLSDVERAAIGDDAGIPWQRVCPACGHHPAAVGVYGDEPSPGSPAGEADEVVDDPWLGCPACGAEWQAPGVRYVLAEIPPLDSPEMEAFLEDFVATLRRSTGRDGPG